MSRFNSAIWILGGILIASAVSPQCNGGIIAGVGFDLKTPGATFPATVVVPITIPGVTPGADGVSFTATLTVVGGPGAFLSQDSSGVGVAGAGIATAVDFPGVQEFLTVSMAISAITGGSVIFDGFATLELNVFSGSAVLSDDPVFGGANDFQTIGVGGVTSIFPSPAAPTKTTFTIFPATPFTSAFQLGALTGQFTTTASLSAVPEPSTFLALSGIAAVVGFRRIRRTGKSVA